MQVRDKSKLGFFAFVTTLVETWSSMASRLFIVFFQTLRRLGVFRPQKSLCQLHSCRTCRCRGCLPKHGSSRLVSNCNAASNPAFAEVRRNISSFVLAISSTLQACFDLTKNQQSFIDGSLVKCLNKCFPRFAIDFKEQVKSLHLKLN